jgi:hypothetical protein
VQPTETERADAKAVLAIRCGEVQPHHRVPGVGFASLGDEDADAASEAMGRERDDGLAGRVEPLNVVDRHQHRSARREPLDRRCQGRRDDTTIGLRPFAARPQQHPVGSHLLDVGKLREQRGVHVAEEVGDRGIRQRRLGLADPRRNDRETPLASLRHRRQPERRLADARLTLDEQSRGPRSCGLQELAHGPELLRTAHHAGTHGSPIVTANPEFTDRWPDEQQLTCPLGR